MQPKLDRATLYNKERFKKRDNYPHTDEWEGLLTNVWVKWAVLISL